MAPANREWVFLKRPGKQGFSESDFELRSCGVPNVGEGELLIATHLISVDPTMRNAMGGDEVAERTEGSGYYDFMNWKPGSVVAWMIIGRVEQSKAAGFAVGDMVTAFAPLQELTTAKAAACSKLPEGVPPTAVMSMLGGTAATGYCSAKYIGEPKNGDVAFVSGAAGATGLVACQTLKNLGCRVVGSAGSDEKVALLESIGVQGFNYKKESTLQGLRRLCPGGLNIFYDNVGGVTLEHALEMMNDFGRVVMCGAISQYDKQPSERYGVKNLFHVIAKQLKLQGFIVSSFTPAQQTECMQTLTEWLKTGAVKDWHTAVEGFDKFPDSIRGLFAGINTGKMLVRVPLPQSKL
jgi:hypothetical protein